MKRETSSFSRLFFALFMVIVAAVIFVSGCSLIGGGDDGSSGIAASTISGRVVKGASGSLRGSESAALLADDVAGDTGIAGAKVWIEDLAFDPRFSTFTDASGTYLFANVPPGEHRIVISYLDADTNTRKKARSEARNIGETSTVVMFSNLVGEPVKNVVTGQLRDAAGKFLSAGTVLTLWGETFPIEKDGFFTSSALPESASEAKVFVQLPDGNNTVSFTAPFVSDVVPAFVELKIGAADNGNHAPTLVVFASAGEEPVSKVNPGTMVTLSAVGSDVDSNDRSALIMTWTATSGTLNNGSSDFEKLWTAPNYLTVATITVEVKDPKGATGTVKLPILVGIDNPSQVDTERPTVELTADVEDVSNSAPFVVTITFNEPITGFGIIDITVENATLSDFSTVTIDRVYRVKVTPEAAGAVKTRIDENVATDRSNNKNTAANLLTVTNIVDPAESPEKAITLTTYGMLSAGNVVAVPAAVKVSSFKAGLTVSDNAVAEILTSTGGAVVANQATTDVTSNMAIRVTAGNLTTAEYTITLGSSNKAITATTYGTLVAGNVVAVPAAVKVSNFKAGLTVSANAVVEILATAGGSVVANQSSTDVTSSMAIRVIAQDLTKIGYTITLGSSNKAITATTYGTLSAGNVVAIPAAVKVSAFKAGLTVSNNAVVEILATTGGAAVANQTTTDVASGMAIRVTAQDLTSAEYTITMLDYASANIGVLKFVPAGTFQRDAATANTSSVSAFRMSQHEITRAQFKKIMGYDPSDTVRSTGINDPVQMANWYHALAFCNKLSIAEGLTPTYSINGSTVPDVWGAVPIVNSTAWNAVTCNWTASGYRLPTEMEWMWAAMGADTGNVGANNAAGYAKTFSGSTGNNLLGDYAWYSINSSGKTYPTGSKLANELKLFDVSGNVWEWCWDWHGGYPAGLRNDYSGAVAGTLRILRGGGWSDSASGLSVASRSFTGPYIQDVNVGFRVMRR